MQTYISTFGGYLQEPNATGTCDFCALDSTNQFLLQLGSNYSHRWRNYGILWAYIIFNACAAFLLYYLVRVPKTKGKRVKKE